MFTADPHLDCSCKVFYWFSHSLVPLAIRCTWPPWLMADLQQGSWNGTLEVCRKIHGCRKSSSWAKLMNTRDSWADRESCVDVNFQPIVKCQDTIVWQVLCPLCVQAALIPLYNRGLWISQGAFLAAFHSLKQQNKKKHKNPETHPNNCQTFQN